MVLNCVNLSCDLAGYHVLVNDHEVYRDWDQSKAKFIYYSISSGHENISIPEAKIVEESVKQYENKLPNLKTKIQDIGASLGLDSKISRQVLHLLERKLTVRLT